MRYMNTRLTSLRAELLMLYTAQTMMLCNTCNQKIPWDMRYMNTRLTSLRAELLMLYTAQTMMLCNKLELIIHYLLFPGS